MRIHSVTHNSHADGPGVRTVLWLQGCEGMNCPGCWSPLTHSPNDGNEIDVGDLAQQILAHAPHETEGVTISGGEPIQQIISVSALIGILKAHRPHWTFGIFTGYTLVELQRGAFLVHGLKFDPCFNQSDWETLKGMLDFAVTGRYDHRRPITHNLPRMAWHHAVSSANQVIWLFRGAALMPRYRYSDFPPLKQKRVSVNNPALLLERQKEM